MARFIVILAYAVWLSGCAAISPSNQDQKIVSWHVGYQSGSALANYFEQLPHSDASLTGFLPLGQGEDALLARLALIESAQSSLDLQYYIYRSDETSHLLSWRLYQAAQRGVRVRLLLDDMQKRNDHHMAALNAHPNVEIRLFNPHQYRDARLFAMVSDFGRLNHRMHNKSLTADSVASIVGGRNIGNEYFSFESNVEFGDFDLLLYGDAVQQTADQFDLYWNSLYAVPIEWIVDDGKQPDDRLIAQAVAKHQLEQKFTQGRYDFTQLPLYQQLTQGEIELWWGKGEIWYDSPDKVATQKSQLVDNLAELLKTVDHSIVVISPYFVPTESGTKALIAAAQRGIDVTIVTNSLASNDVFAVHGWYSKYRQSLVEGGVTLWEVKSSADLQSKWSITGSSHSSLHAKVVLVDNHVLVVGSMNWDPRSGQLNTEMAAVIEQPEYVAQTTASLTAALEENAYKIVNIDNDVAWQDVSNGITYHSEPDASMWRRIGAWFSGILPIEQQL
ncbi:phospholipase D family protein [Vibrio pacinii]|uniref:phospholipase D family protein n=1 Tax=Vibrio pacinii TaxID=170674 RepID=UPI000B19C875|nr:phospholipase D family protein [Vibrio pacinii]